MSGAATGPAPAPAPDPDPDPGDWTVSLDDSPDAGTADGPGSTRIRTGVLAGAALALAGLAAAAWLWQPGPGAGPQRPRVIGSHLFAPIAFPVPAGATATSDSSYLGVRYASGAALLVTVPTEVLTPSGGRSALPADPGDWLRRQPSVFVSRAKQVELSGRVVTQVDYRRSESAVPRSTFAGTSLFCAPTPCTRITTNARIRATFLVIDGRTVLAEAVWRTEDAASPNGRSMPGYLASSYQALLDQLAERARTGPEGRPVPR